MILVLLLGGSFASYHYIQGTTQTLGSQLDTLEQSISSQQWDAAEKELDTAQQHWDNNKNWWTVLLDHQEVDRIDLSFKRLDKYLVTQNLPLSLGELSDLELLIHHISDSEKLTIENIL
ncbi:DUF4363 family protein [Desulfosporosinus sp. SB140]|uniref:DUF4363 family protein n=1 Tax=Desulfosporosinus paludis TaxID=3115649 RepID=UPI00388D29D5